MYTLSPRADKACPKFKSSSAGNNFMARGVSNSHRRQSLNYFPFRLWIIKQYPRIIFAGRMGLGS
jgi:hypothetical protein